MGGKEGALKLQLTKLYLVVVLALTFQSIMISIIALVKPLLFQLKCLMIAPVAFGLKQFWMVLK